MFENRNWPVASEETVRSRPLVALVKWTVALGITAPEGSVTVPRMAPAFPLCAGGSNAARSRTKRGRMQKIVPRLNGMVNLRMMAAWMRKADRGLNRRGILCAKRATVGIAVERMHVGHLDHDQQRQQRQTHQGGCPESPWLPAAIPAEMWLESCQQSILTLRIHRIRCTGSGRGYVLGRLPLRRAANRDRTSSSKLLSYALFPSLSAPADGSPGGSAGRTGCRRRADPEAASAEAGPARHGHQPSAHPQGRHVSGGAHVQDCGRPGALHQIGRASC